ncbi:MAG: D-glycerate dehydrogenase [Anaerolineae bacterium]|nr:D-glycerate dehydrogenase [Anaerolineae bacterium]
MPKVFVSRRVIGLDRYSHLDLDVWEGSMPPSQEELRARTRGCDGLVSLLTDRIDAAFMDAVPGLKVISQYAVGVNNIDLAAAKARGIPVGHTPGVLTDATADLAFALLFAAARSIVPGAQYVKDDKWKTWEPALLLGQSVYGATLGIIGYGRIGKAVAERSRGFNMRVLVTEPNLKPDEAQGVTAVSLDELLRESDFVTMHTPLLPETHHLISTRELALMKPTAILINTSRGEVIDPAALYEALKAGRPGYAALDVTEPEPLPYNHPLLSLPNCLVIPHLGSATMQARMAMTERAMANLEAGLRGDPLPYRANP